MPPFVDHTWILETETRQGLQGQARGGGGGVKISFILNVGFFSAPPPSPDLCLCIKVVLMQSEKKISIYI